MSGTAMAPTFNERPQPGAKPPVKLKLADAVKQAQALFQKGQYDGAEALARAILQKQPGQPNAVQLLAGAAEKRGQLDRAVEILRRSLSGGAGDTLSLMNLCRILRVNGRLQESRAAGAQAAQYGTVPEAFIDYADTLSALGEHDEAFEFYQRAAAARPALARGRLGLAQALLMRGEFTAGWSEYEWRYKMAATQNILPKFKQPQWNGMPLKALRLLVVCEQGYGDCLQFARYLPLVSERVEHVYVGVGAELRSLIESVPGHHVSYHRWEDIPAFDFQITLSSLPLVFGTTPSTIPGGVPYVSADSEKAALWRQRLSERAAGRKTVGFVWQGRPTHPNDRIRSVALGQLTRMLELDNILPVSLQVGHGREQLAQHPARTRVFDPGDELKDFGDTAALVTALDQVVSIDSAIAHLAGALGKPCLVMLSRAGEWRWQRERTDSPWYPSVELVRQDASRTWDGVVAHVCDRLSAL